MNATITIIVLWLAFGASHMLLSSAWLRPRAVSLLGLRGFLAGYALVAFAVFIPLVAYYLGHKHAGPVLWAIPLNLPVRGALYALIAVAFILMVSGIMTPSPASVTGKPLSEPRGVHLLTRHALFMGVGLWALAHLAANGAASDIAFFGGFVVVAIIGSAHQDRRKLAAGDESFRSFHARTPFLPFAGNETLRGVKELSPLAVVLGIAITVAIRLLHTRLFS